MSKDRLICKKCKVTAEVILKKNKPHQVLCPRCGAVEDFKIATEEAARDYAEELLLSDLKIVTKRRKPTSKFRIGKN